MSDHSSARVAGLDGLRAIAIAPVFWMHLGVANMVSISLQPIYLGRQGVCLFFALSGYLITQILLRETILWRFYWRRSLRIFPAFYAYLGMVGLCWAAGLYHVRAGGGHLLDELVFWSSRLALAAHLVALGRRAILPAMASGVKVFGAPLGWLLAAGHSGRLAYPLLRSTPGHLDNLAGGRCVGTDQRRPVIPLD
ncbi:acyltransferase [bacterium]|nr:acyltransferase [bacterium]